MQTVKLLVKIQKLVFYSDMTNNRVFEWLYFWVNIVFDFRDIKTVTDLSGPSTYMFHPEWYSLRGLSPKCLSSFEKRKVD